MEVKMLNINSGSNDKLLEKCRPLCDYSQFVSSVRKYKAKGKTMEAAVHLSIRELPDDSPIKKYLLSMEAEVVFSCITEYDEQKVMNQFREEGREEGRAEGELRLSALMSKLLSSGKTEEAKMAASDPSFRNQLYKQYNL